MSSSLYVNKVGGVIVHYTDGSSVYLGYGEPVNTDLLADHVDVSAFTDDKQRKGPASDDPIRAAQLRAALADTSGGSSASAVPSSYPSLGEQEAAQVMVALAADPQAQANLLVHETLSYGNRQIVHDAASAQARDIAEQLLAADAAQLREVAEPDTPVAATPDPQGAHALDTDAPIPAPASTSDPGVVVEPATDAPKKRRASAKKD